MARKTPVLVCSDADRVAIDALARSHSAEARLVKRAKIIQGCLSGKPGSQIARELQITPNSVIEWRRRFEEKAMEGLRDNPRSGKPVKYDSQFQDAVLRTLDLAPPSGQACWDGPAVARHLDTSVHAVWRVLRKLGVCLSRQRSWCVSTDPEFAAKAADIVGLYLNPPEKAIVISVDEKPGIQALERATGYVQTSNGKIVRGYRSTYKRHGTLNLFAALEIASGAVHTKMTELKRRIEFIAFMDEVVADLPKDKEIHVILDNYASHKKNDQWLQAHPNVFFHYTPTSASWLNMVEIWFGILTRKALRGANFENVEQLRKAIEEFIAAYGPTAKPFIWRKREVKGSQLKNTIVNLCN
jgi:transposase